MNIKSDIAVFKGNLKTAIQMWSSDLVDEILSSPVRRRNIKRYIENWLDFQDERINKLLDNFIDIELILIRGIIWKRNVIFASLKLSL